MRSDEGREKPGTVKGVMKKCKATISSQMYADKSNERYPQMSVAVSSIVIPRQCCPHRSAPRTGLLQRSCCSLTGCGVLSTDPVKKWNIRSYHSLIRSYLQ